MRIYSFFHFTGREKLLSIVCFKSIGFFIPEITMSAQKHNSDIFFFAEPNLATLDVLQVLVVVSSLGCLILAVFTTPCPNPNNGMD